LPSPETKSLFGFDADSPPPCQTKGARDANGDGKADLAIFRASWERGLFIRLLWGIQGLMELGLGDI